MATMRRRAARRVRRAVAALWWAGALLWAALILGTQRPWEGAAQLQTSQWLLAGLGGLLVGTLQRRGKDYWPANTLLGLAYGSDKVMFFALTNLAFGGDADAFRAWASAVRLGLYACGGSFLLLAWALWLVVRVNRARAGGSVDLAGHTGPPTEEQAREALFVLTSAHRHHLASVLMLPEYRELVAYMRRAEVAPLVEAELARRAREGGG